MPVLLHVDAVFYGHGPGVGYARKAQRLVIWAGEFRRGKPDRMKCGGTAA